MLLSGYRLPMGNNIDIVVVQQYTTHNKILPWASHILRVPAFFFYSFRNLIYVMLALLNSFHIMVQTLKIGGLY